MTVLGKRYEDGAWRNWEHVCDGEDLEAVIDSARAKSAKRRYLRLRHHYRWGAYRDQ